MPTLPHITPADVAKAVAEHCSIEPWNLGENVKDNETVNARDLYVMLCDHLELIGAGTPEDWSRIRAPIESDHTDRALRKMRGRAQDRYASKLAQRGDHAWFPSSFRKLLEGLEDLNDDRGQSLPGLAD